MTYPEIVQAMKDGKCRGGKLPEDIGIIQLANDERAVGDVVVVWQLGHSMDNAGYILRDDWEMVDVVEQAEPDSNLPFTTATDVICIETSFPSPSDGGKTNYLSVTEWPNGMGFDVVTAEYDVDGKTEQRFGLDFTTFERLEEGVAHLRDRIEDRDDD